MVARRAEQPIARYENAFLIYNPRAGKLNRNQGQLLQRIIEALAQHGHRVTPVQTTGPRTAQDIARRCIENGADCVLAAGGDGTMNEVLNGVAGSNVPMGIIPAGTANVLGVELRIAGGAVGAANELHEYVPRRISLGCIRNAANPDGRYFGLMLGAGLDAMIVYSINADLKSRFGKGAYWLAGFSQLGKRFPVFTTTISERQHRCSFALASRVRNYGGDITIAPTASLLDEDFELVLFEGEQSWVYLRYFLGILTSRLARTAGVTLCRAKQLRLDCASDPRIYVQVDGEYAGSLPAEVQLVPDALTLLVPPRFARLPHG